MASREVDEFLLNNDLTLTDLAYAFTDFAEAYQVGGHALACAWQQARAGSGCAELLPPLHSMLAASRVTAAPPTSAPEPRRVRFAWRGLSVRAKSVGIVRGVVDLTHRKDAAQKAVRMAADWGASGTLGMELASVTGELHGSVTAKWVRRLERFDAGNVQAHLRTWRSWSRWCAARGLQVAEADASHVVDFLHSLGLRKKLAPSMPQSRWYHLKWCERYLGAPIRLDAADKPPRLVHSDSPCADNQAAALDPAVILEVERLLLNDKIDENMKATAVAMVFLWTTTLRFRHYQRSVCERLNGHSVQGYCVLGKKGAGFSWVAPRFGPLGFDCGEFVFKQWSKACERANSPVQYLLFDTSSLTPFTRVNFTLAARTLLAKIIGSDDALIFTTYSLRRAMPTLADMRNASEADRLAVGDWRDASCGGGGRVSAMSVRYAGDKLASATEVKLFHVLIVAAAAPMCEVLSWSELRKALNSVDLVVLREKAARWAAELPGKEAEARFVDTSS